MRALSHDSVASLASCMAGGGIALLSLMFRTHIFFARALCGYHSFAGDDTSVCFCVYVLPRTCDAAWDVGIESWLLNLALLALITLAVMAISSLL